MNECTKLSHCDVFFKDRDDEHQDDPDDKANIGANQDSPFTVVLISSDHFRHLGNKDNASSSSDNVYRASHLTWVVGSKLSQQE